MTEARFSIAKYFSIFLAIARAPWQSHPWRCLVGRRVIWSTEQGKWFISPRRDSQQPAGAILSRGRGRASCYTKTAGRKGGKGRFLPFVCPSQVSGSSGLGLGLRVITHMALELLSAVWEIPQASFHKRNSAQKAPSWYVGRKRGYRGVWGLGGSLAGWGLGVVFTVIALYAAKKARGYY